MKDPKGKNEEIPEDRFCFYVKKDRDPQKKESGHDHKTAESVNILLFFFQYGKNRQFKLSNNV
jgi:hypothetical protein